MAEQKWHQRYSEGIVIGILTAGVLSVIGYLNHVASPWFRPLFYGLIAGGIVLIACLGVMLVKHLPLPNVIPSSKNIERCVRGWLDNHKVAVKNDPGDNLHFRLRITLDSGQLLTVLRSMKEFTNYVQIFIDLGVRGENTNLLEVFTDEERNQLLFDIRVELARAKVGYSGLVMPPENFMLFRRVPILPGLTEFYFMSMIGDIEAATNLVLLMYLKAKQQADERSGNAAPVTLPSTSDTPTLALPRA
jgi:hypothetical protein